MTHTIGIKDHLMEDKWIYFILGLIVGNGLGALTIYLGVTVTEKLFNKRHPNEL